MARFKIKAYSRPQRCDVCHKDDQFNTDTGICARCSVLPVEQLVNQDLYSIRTIPPSRPASYLAGLLAFYCFLSGVIIITAVFQPHRFSLEHLMPYWLPLFSLINIPFNIVLKYWATDKYNELLDIRVIAMARYASFIGLLSCLLSLFNTALGMIK